jgi:hypothetical protein
LGINFEKTIKEYCDLINIKYTISLCNNEKIDFTFKGEHLPHLMGLNHLVDIPILEKYSNNEVSANYIFKNLINKNININVLEKSKYYDEIYENKLKYFNIKSLLEPMKIIKFDPFTVKNFVPKIDKVSYMFWDYIEKENSYGHFGIGFQFTNGFYFPNTFFFRNNKDYIEGQKEVFPSSLYIKPINKNDDFKIYWTNVRKNMNKNTHYKYLRRNETTINKKVDEIKKRDIDLVDKADIKRHFELLRLDEIKKVYLPYLSEAEIWNNNTKRYLLNKIDNYDGDYKPNEIKSFLNEIPQ